MKTKDEWVSKTQVARECAKCVLEGKAPESLNGSMIAARLNTKGRHTVYRFVEEWKAEQGQRADLPDFFLTEDAREKVLIAFTAIVGDVVLAEREAAIDNIRRKNGEVDTIKQEQGNLMEDLESTEAERDAALEQVADFERRLAEATTSNIKLAAAFDVMKRDRDALINRFMSVTGVTEIPDLEDLDQLNLL